MSNKSERGTSLVWNAAAAAHFKRDYDKKLAGSRF